MPGSRIRSTSARFGSINVTPFVGVALVLLVIFRIAYGSILEILASIRDEVFRDVTLAVDRR